MNRNLYILLLTAIVGNVMFGTLEDVQARGNSINYNNVPTGGLVRWDSHVSNQEQSIQNQLSNNTNLTSTQQAALQSRLSSLQSTQTNLNGALSTDLQNKQTSLQNMLSSGQLSSTQQTYVQSRLNQVQSQESAINSGGNPFSNQATWNRGYNGSSSSGTTTAVSTNPYGYSSGMVNPMTTASNPYAYGSTSGSTYASNLGSTASNSLPQLIGQDERAYNQAQWIQNQLATGNLTAQQQAYLQNRLVQLESTQTSLNGNLSTALQNKQASLQNLASSGNLSSTQQSYVQNHLTQIQNQQSALSSGNDPFSTPGLWTYQGSQSSSSTVATASNSY